MRSKLAGVGGFVVLVGAAIGVMVFLHKRDPGNQAEAHATELIRAAHGGTKPEASLAAFDTVITGAEWAELSDATRGAVGAEVVRLASELVPRPFTQRHVDDANRVVARYRALPDAGRQGTARDAMLSTLEGWIKGLPTAEHREARITLLRLELEVASGNDTLSIASRLATERLEMARAIEDAWPVDALGFLAEEPRDPQGVPEAGKILARLVALNRERAEEEKRGIIRWLRPEFQNPAGTRAETQATLAEAGLLAPTGKALPGKAAKTPWPKRLADRVTAVRDLLAEAGAATETTAADLAKHLRGARPEALEPILESLVAVGLAQEIPSPVGGRAWRALR